MSPGCDDGPVAVRSGTRLAPGCDAVQPNTPLPGPDVLLGGAGGRVPGGRFLSFPGENHCRLLVSIANAMDIGINAFGGFDDGSGPLPGLVV